MFGLKNDEIFTCFLLIIVGYCIAKMFSRRCEGFSVGAFPLCPNDSRNPVDECFAHSGNCDKLYTHTIGNESDYSVHTCKDGPLGYCISSGNKCVFPEGHDCQEPADCESSVCENGKCAPSSPPPPPPPSCPSGEEYCISGDGSGNKGCYPNCKNGKERGDDCKCWPNCCFPDPDKCPGGPYICDSCENNNDCLNNTTCVNGQCVKV